MTRGQIWSEEAYAKGKMLDHSKWAGILPRNMTPSDIDAVFDFAGFVVYVELKPDTPYWGAVSKGQRLMYQNTVINAGGRAIAVCAHHITPSDRKVDSVEDVVDYEVMAWNPKKKKLEYFYGTGTLVKMFRGLGLIH